MNVVAQILASVDLLSVLPADCNLKSVGRDRWRGKCPIGQHAPGGFSVLRHADGHLIFQCFSCHARGSVIDMMATLEGITNRDAIRKLAEGKLEIISEAAMLTRAYDAIDRHYESVSYVIACDDCGDIKTIASELGLTIEMSQRGTGGWDFFSDGSARCGRCNIKRVQCQTKNSHGRGSNATQ